MKLWVIRHAKSDWGDPALSDFDRPLNRRGNRDGPEMQAWLSRQDHPASWIWSSKARRARATADFVAKGFENCSPTIVEDNRLYLANPEVLLEVIRETPEPELAAAVIAHNPGMTQLVNLLAGEAVLENLPTLGVVRFELPGRWSDLRFGIGKPDLSMSPKRLNRQRAPDV